MEDIALKFIGNKEMGVNEFNIHRLLARRDRKGYVPILYGKLMQTNRIILAMEYMCGTLADVAYTQEGLSQKDIQNYFRQLVSGLIFIHRQGIVHRDIKPRNLLISSNKLKIADFGLSCKYRFEKKEHLITGHSGTLDYFAPEMTKERSFEGPPLDVWASGVVLLNMKLKDDLWNVPNMTDPQYRKYKQIATNSIFTNKIEAIFYDLLGKILCEEVEERASLADIKTHKWLTLDF